MPTWLQTFMPYGSVRRKWGAVSFAVVTALALTLWCIYVDAEYGIALFLMIPCYLGFVSTVIAGVRSDMTWGAAIWIGSLALVLYTGALLLLAIEGVMCIVMAAPIGLVVTMLGSLIGYVFVRHVLVAPTTTAMIALVLIPMASAVESTDDPEMLSVTTSIEIKADRERVWENVVQFPRLTEPTELMFNAGIAYPIGARIEGSGVGAVRYCTFTTGDFVEPITVYDAPQRLAFDVVEQPAPMVELSLWDVDAPHLHGFFVSKRGQFTLTQLPNGNTLLEGTTWYQHRISPAFYWQWWSHHIVHAIHMRVLEHIKRHAEKSAVTR